MAYTSLADIPTDQRAYLDDLRNRWEKLTGNSTSVPDWMLVEMANSTTGYQSSAASPIQVHLTGPITNLLSFGQYMLAHVNTGGAATGALTIGNDLYKAMPWAFYGLDADQYQSQATTFSTEFKKLTGQDIPPAQLADAFESVKDNLGGFLTGSEYSQKLQQDANIQKTYGWVKYGMDYQQFQQQKLQMRQAFGRDLTDSEATTQLQYDHAAQGGDHSVQVAPPPTPTQTRQAAQGVSGSLIR